MKHILIIGDGMADRPNPSLGGKTPMEYAKTPFMDMLAKKSLTGMTINCPEEMAPGSDTGIMDIMGYEPRTYFTGRAPLEAAASDIKLRTGNVAYRCNLVSFEDKDAPMCEKKLLSHCAGSIEGEDALEVMSILLNNDTFAKAAKERGVVIHPSPSFRHMTVQETGDVKGCHFQPPHEHLGEVCKENLPTGGETAKQMLELMEIAHDILDKHEFNNKRRNGVKAPANGIWFWAEGTAVELPSFQEKFGKTGAMISAVPLCQGIAKLIGIPAPNVPGATGELETNYEGKVFMAMELLADRDMVVIHIEAPDECAHAGDMEGKIDAIERIDSRVVAPILQKMEGKEFRLLIVSDHETFLDTRGHGGDYVPFLLYDSTCELEEVAPQGFHEEECRKGCIFPANYKEGKDSKAPKGGYGNCMNLLFQGIHQE